LMLILGAAAASTPAQAQMPDAELSALVNALAPGNFKDREAAIGVLAATGDQRAVPILQTLMEGELYVDGVSGHLLFTAAAAGKGDISDPVTGASLPGLATAGLDKVKVNNGLRRVLRTAIGQMTLLSEDSRIRLSAAQSMLRDADPTQLELLDSAIAAEADAG